MKFPFYILIFLLAFGNLSFANEGVQSPISASQNGSVKIKIDGNWLMLPMKGDSDYNIVRIIDKDGGIVFRANTLLTGGKPQWYAPVNVSKYKGQEVTLLCESGVGVPSVMQVDELGFRNYAADRARPTYHLTSKDGFMGALCGLVYFKGKWNAYYLYNPYAMTPMGPYYIAHAVSDDLVNWRYERNVAEPQFVDNRAVYPVGGSAYFDKGNKSGLFDSDKGIILVVENSDGKTFLNVGPNAGLVDLKGVGGKSRGGPTLTYCEEHKIWVIAKSESAGKKSVVNLYTSPDLKSWKLSDSIDVKFHNPSLRKMSVSANESLQNYVLWSGDGSYLVGDFDGAKFSKNFDSPARLFFGDARTAQFWQNAPDGREIVSARIEQPGDLMRTVGQSFSQSLSLPWEMRLADTRRGFRLRASIPSEIVEHFGQPQDALGIPFLQFRSNLFSLPNAVGNNFAVVFTLDTRELNGFSLRAGVAKFGYSKTHEIYEITRIEENRYAQKATDPRPDGFTNIVMFVDYYSVETFFMDGSAVLFMGDSYINPEQEIKVGCNGEIYVEKVSRIPILRTTAKQRAKMARDLLEATKSKDKK